MTAKNFNIKNGLSIAGTEVITSAGAIAGGAVNEAVDDRVNSLLQAGAGIGLSYNDAAGTLTITGNVGDITGVNAGAGLTGTASSGDATLNIGAGTGITVNADTIEADMTAIRASIDGSDLDMGGNKVLFANMYSAEGDLPSASTYHGMFAHVHGTGAGYFAHAGAWKKLLDESSSDTNDLSEGSGNLYFTDARADARITNALVDEDNMASNSATKIPSQQSVKAYVDSSILTKDNTDEITEGSSNLYHTTERVADVVGTMVTSNTESGITVAYDDSDNTLDFTVGTLNQNTTGSAATLTTARTINGASFNGSADISFTTDATTEGSSNLYFSNERVDDRVNSLIVAGTGITSTYDDAAGTLTLNGQVGDVTSVVAGDGLSGGGSSGDVTVNLDATVAGDGLGHSSGVLSVTVDDSSIETNSDTLRVKATGITNAMLAGSIANAKLSNSSVTINSQSVALGAAVTLTSANIGENTNLYYTDERVDDRVNTLITDGANITSTYDDSAGTLTIATDALDQEQVDDRMNAVITAGTNITKTYDDSAGTLTITGSTDGEIRALHSAVSNGIGGLAYNASTGAYTYDGPSATDIRNQLSAGTGVGFSGGAISIGQAVATSSNVTFGNLILSGDLTVNGTTSTVSSTNTTMTDSLIELGNGTTGSPSNDAGIVIERGDETNVFMGWDDSATGFVFGTTSATGASTGAISVTPSAVSTGALTITNASNSGGTARNVYQSTSAPSSGDGAVGDLWVLYS